MSATPLGASIGIIEGLALAVFTGYLLRYYGAKGSPLYALAFVYLSWYLGFFGTLFLPIDIAEAYASRTWSLSNTTQYRNVSGLDTGGGNGGGGGLPSNSSSTPLARGSFTLTPTPTPTLSASKGGVPGGSNSPSSTPTPTPTPTPTASFTGGVSPSVTPTQSGTPPVTPSATSTPPSTQTQTPTPSFTPTPSSTMPIASRSRTPSITRSRTRTKTRTRSPMPSGWCEFGCSRELDEAGGSNSSGGAGGGRLRLPVTLNTPSSLTQFLLNLLFGGGGGTPRNLQGSSSSSVTPSPTLGPDVGAASSASPSPSTTSSPSTSTFPNATAPSPSLAPIFVGAFSEVEVRNGPLESAWVTVYWLTAVLTYVFVPVVQEFLAAGEFSFRGRLMASVKINLIFYALLGLLGFFALAYVVLMGFTLEELQPVLISLANTSGLVIIVLLLGYGAAEVPNELWRKSNPRGELRRLYFNAPAADGALFDAKQELGDLVKDTEKLLERAEAMRGDKALLASKTGGKLVEEGRALQEALPTVTARLIVARALLGKAYAPTPTSKAAAEKRASARAAIKPEDDEDEKGMFGGFKGLFKGSESKYKGVSVAKLAALNKKLGVQINGVVKASARWEELVLKCMELEYVVARVAPPVPQKHATADGGTYFVINKAVSLAAGGAPGSSALLKLAPQSSSSSSFKLPQGMDAAHMDVLSEKAGVSLLRLMCCPRVCGGVFNKALWWFKIHLTPPVYKLLWALCEVFSLLLLWSEATIWLNLTGLVTTNLSVFGQLLMWADDTGGHEYLTILFISMVPLAYMCLVSMYAVFKLKVLGMDIAGNKNTDPYSLLVNASLMNRLQFSLAFNYLNVLFHSPNKEDFPDTAFLHSVGAKMSLSVLDWFIPLLMVALYLCCKLKLFDLLMRRLGYEEAGSPVEGNLEHNGAVQSGKSLVVRGRATLGLGVDDAGGSEEERAKASELARNKRAIIMARMEARRAGKDPDSVARLDGGELTTDTGGVGGGGGDDMNSSSSSSSSTMASLGSLASFASAAGVGGVGSSSSSSSSGASASASGTGMGAVSLSGMLGLGALASKRSGAGGVGSGATGPGRDEEQGGATFRDPHQQQQHQGRGGRQGGGGSSSSSNDITSSSMFAPPKEIVEPPSLASLLKGKRAPSSTSSTSSSSGAVEGGQGFVAPRTGGGYGRAAVDNL